MFDHSLVASTEVQRGVPETMTRRAEEIALLGFAYEPLPRAMPVPDTEVLRRCVPMMELKGSRDRVIPAVHAPAAEHLDEFRLASTASLLQRPVALLVLPPTPVLTKLLGCTDT